MPLRIQKNNTAIHKAVQIWYTVSIIFWIFPCMKQVSSKNPLFQWKYWQELCLKIKLILEDVNFSFPNTRKRKIWTMLCIYIAILDEYCFRDQNQKSSWNLVYTSKKFKANTRYVSATTAVQITRSKNTIGKKTSSLNTTHKIDGTIIRNAFFQYTAIPVYEYEISSVSISALSFDICILSNYCFLAIRISTEKIFCMHD